MAMGSAALAESARVGQTIVEAGGNQRARASARARANAQLACEFVCCDFYVVANSSEVQPFSLQRTGVATKLLVIQSIAKWKNCSAASSSESEMMCANALDGRQRGDLLQAPPRPHHQSTPHP